MNLAAHRRRCRPTQRHGRIRVTAIVGVMILGGTIAGGIVWYSRLPDRSTAHLDKVIVQPVKRELFLHRIAQRGEIESASNIDVYCEVKSPGGGANSGVAVLDVIPEGTQVKKGDKLATLDSSALEKERLTQQILCNTSEAILIQSRNLHETALIAKEEYIHGTFVQAEQTILGEIFVAEENLRRAAGYLKYSGELAAKNFYTTLQLEADKFAVDKARNDLETAKTKLRVLRDYTQTKTVKQLEADIKTTQAKLRTDESTHALDMQKLAEIDAQIGKCTIRAPSDGQLVYNNENEDWDENRFVMQPGALARERQILFRLPDPNHMQVKAKINESSINRVKLGMTATIKVDAFPDLDLHGVVTKVNDYPEPSGWRGSNVKEYAAFVEIENPPPGMRPGMTADTSILVEELPDMLQVPVQAVIEHGGRHYCLMKEGARLAAREVLLGSTNDKFLVVEDGVSEGDQVLLNPRVYLEEVELPQLPPTGLTAQRDGGAAAQRSVARDDRLAADTERNSTSAESDTIETDQSVGGGGGQ